MGYKDKEKIPMNRQPELEDENLNVVEIKHKSKHHKKDIYDIIGAIQDCYRKNKPQFFGILAVIIILAIIVVVNITGHDGKEKLGKTEEVTKEENVNKGETEGETVPELTISPEAVDSELATLVSNFYNAYVISGDINELAKYIDSTTGIDENRLSVNKKYIEQISDFQCYQSNLDIIDEDYTVLIVTYKTKLYNYAELLPSIDILFLVNGDSGYRVHNLTVGDEFDKQKIENDGNFQILEKQVSEELSGLLAANAELNDVYNLYLNPNVAEQ